MAGIGHSTDHPSPWTSQSQFTMGRAMMHDLSKPISNIGGNLSKRALFGSGTSGGIITPSFSDVSNLCASGYNSRPGSSQHNGEILGCMTSGLPVRSTFATTSPETNSDNASYFFNTVGLGSSQSTPVRNISEPLLFVSLPNTNRTTGDQANGRLGLSIPGSVKPLTDPTSVSSSRNVTNLFQSHFASESTTLTSITPASRGLKLDLSDFPPILNSVSRSGNSSSSGAFHTPSAQSSLRNYVSAMAKNTTDPGISTSSPHFGPNASGSQNAPPEFSKLDFPALPGQHLSTVTATNTSTPNTLSASSIATSLRSLSLNTPNSIGTGSLNSHRSFTQSSSTMLPSPTSSFPSLPTNGPSLVSGIQLLPNHLVANIPKNMICDQFGMLGLLKLIRVGDYDVTLNMLAPGLDLSSLHNNWQSSGDLHTTFVSPCHDSCIGRPHDMDYAVPPEYLIRHLIADRLPDPPMDQLSEETLFWLFYNCCREETQLVVAKELYQREWRFHKKEQIWLTRVMGSNFTTSSNSEQGDYYFWDPIKAQKSTHQMTILYSDLDDAPSTFRLSSGNLSAFVTATTTTTGPLPNTHSQNLAAYHHHHQQQQQQQQLQQSAYSQALLGRQQFGSGSSSLSSTIPSQQHTNPHLMLSQHTSASISGGQSAASLSSLLSARQQQQKQLSPTAGNYYSSSAVLGRSLGFNPLLGSRPNAPVTLASSVGAMSINSTTTHSVLSSTSTSSSGANAGLNNSNSVAEGSAVPCPVNPEADGMQSTFETNLS